MLTELLVLFSSSSSGPTSTGYPQLGLPPLGPWQLQVKFLAVVMGFSQKGDDWDYFVTNGVPLCLGTFITHMQHCVHCYKESKDKLSDWTAHVRFIGKAHTVKIQVLHICLHTCWQNSSRHCQINV